MNGYDENTYIGFLLAGSPREAVDYLSEFPEQQALARRLTERMEGEAVKRCEDPFVCRVDEAYQRYWRRIFWQGSTKTEAGEALIGDLRQLAGADEPAGEGVDDRILALEALVQKQMEDRGWHYLGGRTAGYFGPYIWKTTVSEIHRVELPSGTQDYTVHMLDGFVSCSWLEYVSLGLVSPGGWQEGADQMYCVASSYPRRKRKNANFQVSLLKHEAQHAWDSTHHPGLSAVMLEYRAKLVELIYYPRLSLFLEFLAEARADDPENAHGMAAHRIVCELSRRIFGEDYVRDPRRWKGKLGKIREQSRACLEQSPER